MILTLDYKWLSIGVKVKTNINMTSEPRINVVNFMVDFVIVAQEKTINSIPFDLY